MPRSIKLVLLNHLAQNALLNHLKAPHEMIGELAFFRGVFPNHSIPTEFEPCLQTLCSIQPQENVDLVLGIQHRQCHTRKMDPTLSRLA